jgi:hypothetical protein
MADGTLRTLLSGGGKNAATTTVFLALPSFVQRLTSLGARAVIVQLPPLSPSDAKNCLLERASSVGRPDLFTADALELIIHGSHGLPRLLRSIAELAFIRAAFDGASQITLKHVAYALASQVRSDAGGEEDLVKTRAPVVEAAVAKPKMPAPAPSPAPALDRSPLKLVAETEKVALPQSEKPQRTHTPRARRMAIYAASLLLVGLAGVTYWLSQPASQPTLRATTVARATPNAAPARAAPSTVAEPITDDQSPSLFVPPERAGQFPSREPPVRAPAAAFVPPPNAQATRVDQDVTLPAADADLPSGRTYGGANNNSRLTLLVHRPIRVMVYGPRNRLLFSRVLQRGDSYRAPNLQGLTVSTPDAGAVEIMSDGASGGYLGEDGVPAERLAVRR